MVECKNSNCKYCFEGDCQLIEITLNEEGVCNSQYASYEKPLYEAISQQDLHNKL